MRCSGPVEQGGDPGLDLGHTGEIMSLNWLRNTLVYHQKKKLEDGAAQSKVWASLLSLLHSQPG